MLQILDKTLENNSEYFNRVIKLQNYKISIRKLRHFPGCLAKAKGAETRLVWVCLAIILVSKWCKFWFIKINKKAKGVDNLKEIYSNYIFNWKITLFVVLTSPDWEHISEFLSFMVISLKLFGYSCQVGETKSVAQTRRLMLFKW